MVMAMTRMDEYLRLTERARRVNQMVARRAQLAFDLAFYGKPVYTAPWSGFPCFHLAHNWVDQPQFTPEQRQACRYVLYLGRKQFDASRIVHKWYTRVQPYQNRPARPLSTVEG